MLKRIGIGTGIVLVVWIALLLVLGSVFGERRAQAVADRIGENLGATSAIRDHDLALIRGRLALAHLEARRDDPIGGRSAAR